MNTLLDLDIAAVAAVDEQLGLGREGRLLASVKPDLKHFKELTYGQRVICGRRTLSTFPGGRPLPGRENVLLTHDPDFPPAAGLTVISGLSRLEDYLRQTADGRRIFVIGGAEVYRQLLPWCSRAYLTCLRRTYAADCFFPDLESHPDWELTEESPVYNWEGLDYTFRTYARRQSP